MGAARAAPIYFIQRSAFDIQHLLFRLEAAAERQVQVDALHALLGLHADERRLRGVQRQLPLR